MRDAVALSSDYQAASRRLNDARDNTDALFAVVKSGAIYDRPIPERHRLIFYVGHLEAFDWNLMARGALGAEPFHDGYDKLFSFGIDPVDGRLPGDAASDWPALGDVLSYRDRVRGRLDELLQDFFDSPAQQSEATERLSDGTLLHTAIEHRLMHAETLAYMLHQLPLEKKSAPAGYEGASHNLTSSRNPARMLRIPGGNATLGQPRREDGEPVFGWDNEFEETQVYVPEFHIASHMVTNREFLEFLNAGGYGNRDLWTHDGWLWKERANLRHPVFWGRRDGQFHYRGMFEEIALPMDWPVYVSHAEASAFARWAGKALPTEAQWHRAAYGTPDGAERPYPWGADPPGARHGNFDFQRWNPAASGAHPAGRSGFGAEDLLGNGWEWTATVFSPLPGFRTFSFYPGYSADFFDGKHFVMKGGSARTAACMLRRSFRNWFQPHYQYPYAGFRCVGA